MRQTKCRRHHGGARSTCRRGQAPRRRQTAPLLPLRDFSPVCSSLQTFCRLTTRVRDRAGAWSFMELLLIERVRSWNHPRLRFARGRKVWTCGRLQGGASGCPGVVDRRRPGGTVPQGALGACSSDDARDRTGNRVLRVRPRSEGRSFWVGRSVWHVGPFREVALRQRTKTV